MYIIIAPTGLRGRARYLGENIHTVWCPCNLGLAEHKNCNFENIYLRNLYEEIAHQRYGRSVMDASKMHIVWRSTSQSNFIITHLLSSECQFWHWENHGFECFQDGRQISLPTFYPISKLSQWTVLGYNKFNWEISMFILSCSGWHYCGISYFLLNWETGWILYRASYSSYVSIPVCSHVYHKDLKI